MKGKLYIAVNARYPLNVYQELKKRGFTFTPDTGWLIPIEKIRTFEEVVGSSIEVSEDELRRLSLLHKRIEEVEVEVSEKGYSSGDLEIISTGSIYRVTLPSGTSYDVPADIVNAYIEVIQQLRERKTREIKKRELVEMVLRKLNYSKFFSKDGKTFFWQAFYGDRVRYHTHYYIPAKILEKKGLIKISKGDEIFINL